MASGRRRGPGGHAGGAPRPAGGETRTGRGAGTPGDAGRAPRRPLLCRLVARVRRERLEAECQKESIRGYDGQRQRRAALWPHAMRSQVRTGRGTGDIRRPAPGFSPCEPPGQLRFETANTLRDLPRRACDRRPPPHCSPPHARHRLRRRLACPQRRWLKLIGPCPRRWAAPRHRRRRHRHPRRHHHPSQAWKEASHRTCSAGRRCQGR